MLLNSRLASAALSASLLALTCPAAADPASYCPADGICYQVGVPEGSAAASSGNIYLQLRAPTSYAWVALGTGTSMTGSNMFVLYADGAGNVTVSPRSGSGHVPPAYNADADLELLAGSGVDADAGTMTANVRCGNCESWSGGEMSLSSTSTDWIAAWQAGDPLDSADADATIERHDAHAGFTFDLSQAQVSSDANPYLTGDATSGGGSGSGSGNGDTAAGSGSSGAGAGAGAPWYLREIPTLEAAHGILMAIVMAVMYPLGSLLMPVFGKWWLHGAWQGVAWLAMWAGFAIGVVLAQRTGINFTTHHTNLGTAVVALFGVQPALGYLHHVQYVRSGGSRGAASHAHVWYGRALMVLGVVNGGLGLRLAGTGRGLVVAYAVVAAVVFAAYLAGAAFGEVRKARAARGSSVVDGRQEKRNGENGNRNFMIIFGWGEEARFRLSL
ncbi:hypothetical protein F4809DRAFT_164923 [Biscogniauxia mediterranea]|nr:hypothetical protein F4809DRAFT_164923 [Biscogniauxia mediterranea]